jgi:hypothetical protein
MTSQDVQAGVEQQVSEYQTEIEEFRSIDKLSRRSVGQFIRMTRKNRMRSKLEGYLSAKKPEKAMKLLVNCVSTVGTFTFKWQRFLAEVRLLRSTRSLKSANQILVQEVKRMIDKAKNKYSRYPRSMHPTFDRVAKAYLEEQGVSAALYDFTSTYNPN